MSKIYTSVGFNEQQVTPQTKPIPGKDMVKNNAGGFTFKLDQWGFLDRFLMLGSENKGYYTSKEDQTIQALGNVRKCIESDGKRVVDRVVEYSVQGRAPKNTPCVIVLAACASIGSKESREYAFQHLKQVCRTGTDFFAFVNFYNENASWNGVGKRGIKSWYDRPIDRLAVQLIKYQQRNGWSHRDVLRLAHIKPSAEQDALFHWVVKDHAHKEGGVLPKLVYDFESLHKATNSKEICKIIEGNKDITWEMIPTQFLKDHDVLDRLVPNMGLTALIRQLGRMSSAEYITNDRLQMIGEKLLNEDGIKKQRVHPVTLYQALKQYSAGSGEKGTLTWKVDKNIAQFLDQAIYMSFTYLEDPLRDYDVGHLVGVDFSGSMTNSLVNGSKNLYANEVAAVMALSILRANPNCHVFGFDYSFKKFNLNPKGSISDAMKVMSGWGGGSTDCSLPMSYAIQNKINNIELFTVITDNETYAGRIQPVQALKQYRDKYNPYAKMCVIGTSVNNFTIADPNDAGMMDIAGFDSHVPKIITEFTRR